MATTPTSTGSSEPTSTGATTSTPAEATAPPVGTTLVQASVTGSANVITNGRGFSIVDDATSDANGSETDESKVTTYNAAGQQLTEIPSADLTGTCGAADVEVPHRGRLILTELIANQPAEGVKPEVWSVSLKAWSAVSGAEVWSTTIVPTTEQQPSCHSTAGQLESFASTEGGAWGVYGSGEPSAGGAKVLNLDTGAMVSGVKLDGVLGRYGAVVDSPPNGSTAYYTVDPESGQTLGKTTARIDVTSLLGLDTASSTPSGTSASYLSSDGQRLLGVVEEGHGSRAVAYSLPGFQILWTRPSREFYPRLVGDGGGVAIESVQAGSGKPAMIVGFNDKTGEQEWTIPGNEPQVCGITGTEMMLGINGQQAIIDLKNGQQTSYSSGSCPSIIAGGIAVSGGSDGSSSEPQTLTVTQGLTP